MSNRSMPKTVFPLLAALVAAALVTGCDRQTRPITRNHPVVTSLIQVEMCPDSLLADGDARADLEEFRVFKDTQAQLIKSEIILAAALRTPETARLPIFKQQKDPIRWLQDNLQITFPGDSEIMQVSLAAPDPKEAVTLVNSVANAYLKETVERQRQINARELATLEELLANKEREIRKRRTTLKTLADELGIVDPDILKMQTQAASRQLSVYQQQLSQAQYDLRQLEADREIARQALARLGKPEPEADTTGLRPELAQIAQEMAILVNQLGQVVLRLSDVELSQRLQNDLVGIQQQVAVWQQLLSARLGQMRRAELQEKIADTDVRIRLAADHVASLEKQIDQQRGQFERLGQSSVELEMMRTDLKNLEEVAGTIGKKLQLLEVEIHSRPRIQLLQKAETPM